MNKNEFYVILHYAGIMMKRTKRNQHHLLCFNIFFIKFTILRTTFATSPHVSEAFFHRLYPPWALGTSSYNLHLLHASHAHKVQSSLLCFISDSSYIKLLSNPIVFCHSPKVTILFLSSFSKFSAFKDHVLHPCSHTSYAGHHTI